MYFTFFKERMDFAWAKADLVFAYRQYARLMEHWRAVLPRERFIAVDYEALIADREAVTRQLIAFGPDPPSPAPVIARSRRRRSNLDGLVA
jgi:hypothetical protein